MKRTRKGTALALSGGGFRATLFHAGALIRLNELGVLRRVARFTGVSGGAIALGVLANAWPRLRWEGPIATNLGDQVIAPLEKFCSRRIDLPAIFTGVVQPRRGVSEVARSLYKKHLFGSVRLRELPAAPQFVFQATNLATGRSFRFCRDYVGDYLIGTAPSGAVSLATAVAASAAFPPMLSPVALRIDPSSFRRVRGAVLWDDIRYRRSIRLTDGGVYDNLGLEPAWDQEEVLVSDAGAPFEHECDADLSWPGQMMRAFAIATDQSRSLRKRWLVDQFVRGAKRGTYWGITTRIEHYPVHEIAISEKMQREVSLLRTRLSAFTDAERAKLINLGYALADAACRSHVGVLVDARAYMPRPEHSLA